MIDNFSYSSQDDENLHRIITINTESFKELFGPDIIFDGMDIKQI